jgi:tetratricopeptide (TPR) repeat protein
MRLLLSLTLCTGLLVSARADLARANALVDQQRYAEAQALYEAHVDAHPDDATALMHLGRLARMRQDLSKAVEYLEKAVTLQPDEPAIQYEYGAAASLHADTLGMSFRAASVARRGRAGLEKAVELAPDNLRYRLALLEFYSTAPSIVGGGMTKAYEQAEAIRRFDPVQGALAAGGLALREKRPKQALIEFKQALSHAPDHAMALFRLGEAAAVAGEDTAAGVEALEKALSQEDASLPRARAWWRLGQLRAQAGDVSKARESYQAALKIDPMNREIAADLARLPRSSAE